MSIIFVNRLESKKFKLVRFVATSIVLFGYEDKELKFSFKQIKEFLDESNEILMKFRGSNERIVLQRILNNKIPKPGCLKI